MLSPFRVLPSVFRRVWEDEEDEDDDDDDEEEDDGDDADDEDDDEDGKRLVLVSPWSELMQC